MYELGEVIEVDGVNAKVRVRFTQKKLDSFWLSVLKQNTGDHKYYCMPSVGEAVVCLTDKYCESGIVIGSIYTAKNPPLYDETKIAVNLKDGTSFLYDKESGNININVVGDQVVTIGGSGKVIVTGDAELTVNGECRVMAKKNAAFIVEGNIDADAKGNILIKSAVKADVTASVVNVISPAVNLGDGAKLGVVHEKSPCPLFGVCHLSPSVVTKTAP